MGYFFVRTSKHGFTPKPSCVRRLVRALAVRTPLFATFGTHVATTFWPNVSYRAFAPFGQGVVRQETWSGKIARRCNERIQIARARRRERPRRLRPRFEEAPFASRADTADAKSPKAGRKRRRRYQSPPQPSLELVTGFNTDGGSVAVDEELPRRRSNNDASALRFLMIKRSFDQFLQFSV